ncbi:MAG TPA: glutamate 5-kinase [Candidatus Hydrogenedens sp.]|nr:glutamate 5-kinase [Candidatus Hydrogenedens sp.]HOK08610.1 glutamate 5-kinase [Candidatus Hydrogenedens sp.]HOL19908.1 glutamate 5-kinase [Candidatus Hydrogenedens sp.]HPP58349.1 glutamate 5-kinase [Candidatus Hydrogenedens sp.]
MNKKTIVIKIGTDLVNNKNNQKNILSHIVKQICQLKEQNNLNFIIVSSGAVGCGLSLLGLGKRPEHLSEKQALAAIGQVELMKRYTRLFQYHSKNTLIPAQILITRSDLDNRISYINILNTLHKLFLYKNIIPIINENDTTAIEELRFGDNDTLSARIAVRVDAQLLILLTNVDGLYTANPKKDKNAEFIPIVKQLTAEIFNWAQDTDSPMSVGGMTTKLEAVKIAWHAGIPSVIANGSKKDIIQQVLENKGHFTIFIPPKNKISQRKSWIAFGRTVKGKVFIDKGAVNALLKKGSSLLPVGITSTQGNFKQGDCISIIGPDGVELGRGLSSISKDELDKICGKKTSEIKKLNNNYSLEEVIHRDNMVLFSENTYMEG